MPSSPNVTLLLVARGSCSLQRLWLGPRFWKAERCRVCKTVSIHREGWEWQP